MKKLLLGLVLAGALVLPLSGIATATIVLTNGSFETGNLAGWSSVTDQTPPTVVSGFTSFGGEITYSATDGINFAELWATSEITQNISWAAGDYISFDWAFSAQDYLPFNDFAWFDPGDGSSPTTLSNIAAVGDFGETDWANHTYTYSSAGTGGISWGVTNGEDNVWNSSLLVDNVVTIPNPEPATIILLGIGLAGLTGVAVRRKWKKKAVGNS